VNKDVAKINYFRDRICYIAEQALHLLEKKYKNERDAKLIDQEVLKASINGEIKIKEITSEDIRKFLAEVWPKGYAHSVLEFLLDEESIRTFNLKDSHKMDRINNIVKETQKDIRNLVTTNMDYAYLQDNRDLLATLHTFEEIVNDRVRIALEQIKGIEEQGG